MLLRAEALQIDLSQCPHLPDRYLQHSSLTKEHAQRILCNFSTASLLFVKVCFCHKFYRRFVLLLRLTAFEL